MCSFTYIVSYCINLIFSPDFPTVPPSTPVCKGTEYASVGADATLTCKSAEGVPSPVYAWSHIGSKTPLPLANMVQGMW